MIKLNPKAQYKKLRNACDIERHGFIFQILTFKMRENYLAS